MVGSVATSVVLPTRDRAGGLHRIVAPLLADPAAHEVVVVVDGSRDGSRAVVEGLARADPRVRPVWLDGRGEMAARQAGAEAARGDVLVFVDDDVLAGTALVTGHARHHAARGGLVVLGYMPVPETAEGFASRLYRREYEERCSTYERDPSNVLLHLWAGNFSMRRSDCLAVGLADDAYDERYHPDTDFGLRCLAAGLEGRFDRRLRASHLHRRALPEFTRDARSQGAARVLLRELHGPAPLPRNAFETGLPGPARRVVRLARRPRATTLLRALLGAGVGGAGRLRAAAVEDACARILRRIEQQRGAIDRRRG